MGEIFNGHSLAKVPGLPQSGSLDFDSKQIDWQDCGTEGFLIKPLMEDKQAGVRTWLMKVEAGAFPRYMHMMKPNRSMCWKDPFMIRIKPTDRASIL